MSNSLPATPSPLMQPVMWQGQEYFTSQYFHQQYLSNSEYGGRYRRLDSFMRLLRSIHAYVLYAEQGAIVELRWAALKQEEPQLCVSFQPLFQAAGWNPITLLNGTAQAELHHHLDDELSKQMAVTASTMVARQATNKSTPLPEEIAVRIAAAYAQMGQLFETPVHIVQQETIKQIETRTGVNFRPFLLAAPAQNNIIPDDKMLEPTELAKTLGMKSAVALNRALEQIGWQVKRIGGGWEPTPTGAPHAANHAWTSEHSTKSGYNLCWRVQAVTETLHAHNLLAEES